MSRRIRVGILFGGKSAEHEVSLLSAGSIVEAIDKKKYEVVLIGIDKKGTWYLNSDFEFTEKNERVALITTDNTAQLVNLSTHENLSLIDVVFPVLHGPFGEDGTVQGLLKLANIPFVGADVLASAVGMDKDVTKRLLRDAGLAVGKFLVFNRPSLDKISFNEIKSQLSMPVFVKPANLGSSVGVSKANCLEELKKAVNLAFEYDEKILIEEYIQGREIECSVLGNDDPIASLPGEILPQDEFYSYKAKYIDENGAILEIPAKLSPQIIKKVRDYAVRAFKVLCCQGMARVDFFLRGDDDLIINEINTIPGFTKISMYPKLWQITGISYSELIDRLIQLAIERFNKQQNLRIDALD